MRVGEERIGRLSIKHVGGIEERERGGSEGY